MKSAMYLMIIYTLYYNQAQNNIYTFHCGTIKSTVFVL